MNSKVRIQVERCIDDLRHGVLKDGDLQDLLYLQSETTSLSSQLLGMRIVENGDMSDGPSDPDDWPYQTVLDALRDGWRIIKFPELALMLDDKKTYGLGCDFVLER